MVPAAYPYVARPGSTFFTVSWLTTSSMSSTPYLERDRRSLHYATLRSG
jgi:hypothetical protein